MTTIIAIPLVLSLVGGVVPSAGMISAALGMNLSVSVTLTLSEVASVTLTGLVTTAVENGVGQRQLTAALSHCIVLGLKV